ncbi:uncharacterized protein BT62DRAFT_945425 [Guyanagaster necrorhizus]|uniref:WIBG Mago-binding domain-containing protein n=1 Tax=Guyanagaster necrorhizus TaxID=856835 RepID=A0A9P8AVN4_9AGAR|nr:uncharacterized protein BT62DRAFT_945425 [Guyanagaster necrorhizus MCA 3950]KAG7449286.1 hypothetical protein BT62DRAFT_945425 [Guyanagaster necrorhizus MCA 3950]
MSRPPLNPDQTAAGIAIDPQTLERVIPESRRPDGTIRKQIKIRPGFTPQEDVRRFRGTKQAQMDANVLPKGHIVGWAPPPSTSSSGAGEKSLSKSAKKNAKRKEKREEKKNEIIKDSWEDDDEGETPVKETMTTAATSSSSDSTAVLTPEPAPSTATTTSTSTSTDALASKLKKLEVK